MVCSRDIHRQRGGFLRLGLLDVQAFELRLKQLWVHELGVHGVHVLTLLSDTHFPLPQEMFSCYTIGSAPRIYGGN